MRLVEHISADSVSGKSERYPYPPEPTLIFPVCQELHQASSAQDPLPDPAAAPKKRGRPRKNPIPEQAAAPEKRGRPRKKSI